MSERVVPTSPTRGTLECTPGHGLAPYTDGYRVAYAVILYGPADEDPSQWHKYGVIGYEPDGAVRIVSREGHGSPSLAFSDLITYEASERTKAERAAAIARCAALPAPEGAIILRCDCVSHGGEQWPARLGGGCPRCGQPGAIYTQAVELEKTKKGSGVWIRATGYVLWAFEAMAPIGVKPDDRARNHYASGTALYLGPVSIETMRDHLKSIGWLAEPVRKQAAKKASKKPAGKLRVVR